MRPVRDMADFADDPVALPEDEDDAVPQSPAKKKPKSGKGAAKAAAVARRAAAKAAGPVKPKSLGRRASDLVRGMLKGGGGGEARRHQKDAAKSGAFVNKAAALRFTRRAGSTRTGKTVAPVFAEVCKYVLNDYVRVGLTQLEWRKNKVTLGLSDVQSALSSVGRPVWLEGPTKAPAKQPRVKAALPEAE